MGWDDAFEVFPVLETERLILRKVEITDALGIFDYFSRDEVTKFYDVETLTDEEQAVDLVHGLSFRYRTRTQIRWGITSKESNAIIGSCGFHGIEQEHLKAEVGYELHPSHWGTGIMTEALHKVIDYGFNQLELNRIEAFYHPSNLASQKVLEKNEFKYEGILRQRFFVKGTFMDAALSAIVKEEFLENEKSINIGKS